MEPKSKEKRSDGTLNCPAIETVSNGQMMGPGRSTEMTCQHWRSVCVYVCVYSDNRAADYVTRLRDEPDWLQGASSFRQVAKTSKK